ncbi:hypothetical protein Poly24_38460 [Rosistilla carotiformis]|uniref:Secretin/TonB short N-terminal domain-containing protein n=1 Tax=Rosistilla carotiformis TaxID=2528017 RepID=A0A518JX46_9BACT|nr:DUF4974 domain-containing protein [Rosistilla carotiformis]QDV70127.1 hypothetical protein Poly24_38460 [Rosistilla carotiformis]
MKAKTIATLVITSFFIQGASNEGIAQSSLAPAVDANPFYEPPLATPPDPFSKPARPESPTSDDSKDGFDANQSTPPTAAGTDNEPVTGKRIEAALQARVDAQFIDEPLENVATVLSDKVGIPILINRRALDDIGLSSDIPLDSNIQNVRLESALSIVLDSVDLTYTIESEHLVITTHDDANTKLLTRIYWSQETGLQADYNSVEMLIAIVDPDTWEQLGGPSVIRAIKTESGSSSGFVVTTTLVTHRKLQRLLDMIATGPKEKVIALESKIVYPGLAPN